ncbi:MAG: ferrous iron transport protein B [Armatimonadetes bacterium]|nr:ferrous iron transport protein B [Armatimonadota bacterium]
MTTTAQREKLLVIVGSPNVGKSVLFNGLTGAYVTVSNYPGTTVEVSRGRAKLGDQEWAVVDTPGMYALLPSTEEERVGRRILLDESPTVTLHVVDAKNLERMLPFTLQLIEAGQPVILVCNIMDEAERRGISLNAAALSESLGVPVIPTVSTEGRGVEELREAIRSYERHEGGAVVRYTDEIETAVSRIETLLPDREGFSKRALALLLLQDDEDARDIPDADTFPQVQDIVEDCARKHSRPLSYVIATQRQQHAARLAQAALEAPETRPRTFGERLSDVLITPWSGVPILLLVLYLGLFKFVGGIGAGVVVDFLESHLFEGHINPFVEGVLDRAIPWPVLHDLIGGEYGLITLGLRYALAIVLPIVTFFFVVFSILEDTGYLPRLALLVDRVFKRIGLSGRGVIPLVLGLGCDTMATLVTRTLPTLRERVIATLLLALAVPCSAQLGLILALLAGRPWALAVWGGVIAAVFLLTGFLAARLMPGEAPHFYMELPPLRLPKLSNVLIKTYTRVVWYLKEIIPLFLVASVLIWLGNLSGLFGLAVKALAYPVQWIGLPREAATVFLFGFFRRDYGAAGLYDLNTEHALTGVQLTVATIALTLFLPCVAQFLINVKERGWKVGVAVSIFVLLFSFLVAYVVNAILVALGVVL